MWTTAHYLLTSLFSLRPALSTASGAQSLLVPTPYAIKMALISAAIQRVGVALAVEWWPAIRDLDIALALPERLVVNKTFIKIQRPTRVTKSNIEEIDAAKAAGVYPMGPTIAFREFVQFDGALGIAVRHDGHTEIQWRQLLSQINYLGKRGGFFQLQEPSIDLPELGQNWTLLTEAASSFPLHGTLQVLDDCGTQLTWERANIFTSKSIGVNDRERVLRTIVLPIELQRSSYRYSLYERITP